MRSLRSRALIVSIPVAVLAVGAGGAVAVGQDEASKSPQQVIADVKRDLAKVKSYHLVVTDKADPGTTFSADIFASGASRVVIRQKSTTVRVISLGKTSYINGDAAYWKAIVKGSTGSKVAKKLAGKWVKVPASDNSTGSITAEFSPKRLASCIDSGLGTLSNKGKRSIAGQDAVVIEDKGDKPGTAPGLLYVSAQAPNLPLRLTQTGAAKPGGKADAACGDDGSDDNDTKSRTDATFSKYNKIDAVRAPHGAITLPKSGGSGSGGEGGSTPI
jgi:hypothetical protein